MNKNKKLFVCIFFISFSLLFSSCSGGLVGFFYNRIGIYALKTIDKYFAIKDTQKKFLQVQINDTFVWHKETEIPQYLTILKNIDEYMQDGLSSEEYDLVEGEIKKRQDIFLQRIIPTAASFFTVVDKKQIDTCKKQLEKDYKQSESEKEKANEKYYKNFSSLYSFLVGNLDKKQSEQLKTLIADSPFFLQENSGITKQDQDDFLDLLLTEKGKDKNYLQNVLYNLTLPAEETYRPDQKKSIQEGNLFLKKLILTMDKTLSKAQREFFHKKLLSLADNLRSL